VGEYLTGTGATVSAFYLSNVEEYLRQDGRLKVFCANAATLPVDDASVFIRSARSGTSDFGFELGSELGPMAAQLTACNAAP
jgi:hypothetical protein